MKAYELMALAVKDPEKYMGKRYKVTDGRARWFDKEYNSVEFVKDYNREPGITLVGVENGKAANYLVSIDTRTDLKEIKPEPKPVTFMEAIKAYWDGKTIHHKYNVGSGVSEYIPEEGNGQLIDENGIAIAVSEIMEGDWYIGEP